MSIDVCEYVKKEECKRRTRYGQWIIGVSVGLLAIIGSAFVSMVTYAAGESARANTNYDNIAQTIIETDILSTAKIESIKDDFIVYRANQMASEKAIVNKLEELKDELSGQRNEQRVLLEKIIELQIQQAKMHP